jgi:site-specific DNA recombinase
MLSLMRMAPRGRPLQPRPAPSTEAGPREDGLPSAGPALVAPAVVVAVQEQVQGKQEHARPSPQGARSLLSGLVPCQPCGDAFYGQPVRRQAATGQRRAEASSRGLGPEASRFGGERVGQHTPVRTARLDVAVWREGGGLLAHPARLAEASRRRAPAHTAGQRQASTTLEAQRGQWRQGLARLIDSYAEGVREQHAFEPRLPRLRPRLTQRAEQRQQRAEREALQAEWRRILGHLEDLATQGHHNLEETDGLRKREMMRALVKRVEGAQDQVKVVFRVAQRPGDPRAEKKSLQLCRRSRLADDVQYIPASGLGCMVCQGRSTPDEGSMFRDSFCR